jgi:anti-sigma factor RsiW
MSCEQTESDLDAYLDGELTGEAAIDVRAHLATCVACRQRAAAREALGRLVRTAPYYPAPDRLRARVLSVVSRATTRRRAFAWAAAAALAVSVGGGVTVVQIASARGDTIAGEVVDSHVRSLMAGHLFDVQSTDQHTVKPWFQGKLDFSPPVVDLASIGFPLVGGRLDYLRGRPVAALVYQRQKHTINVFVSPEEDDTPARTSMRAVRGFHVRHWIHGGMSFWAVSDLNDGELSEFSRALEGS